MEPIVEASGLAELNEADPASEPLLSSNRASTSMAGSSRPEASSQVPTSDDGIVDANAASSEKPTHIHKRHTTKSHDKHPEVVAKTNSASDHTLRHQLDDLTSRVKHVWTHTRAWRLIAHCHLPDWLKDNDFLVEGHRPQLNTFANCFWSIFRVHTETGNIWTHMLGCMAFTAIAAYFLTRPAIEIQWQEKLVFSTFFLGAILCMGISFIFHTVYCHSERVGRLFNKLDYCGISLLTMGSFVPWLYYGFYCSLVPKVAYISLIGVMGSAAIVLSMFDAFAAPRYRPVRAGIFILLGLSGAIPVLHYVIIEGFHNAIYNAAMGWLLLMAALYIAGAVIYAARFPERLFPGKFDIWLQSHQIFHVFVVAAAFVHFHGISRIANYRLTFGDCTVGDPSVTS